MTVETIAMESAHKQLVADGLSDVFNASNSSIVDRYFAEDVVLDTTLGDRIEGRDDVVAFLEATRRSFPDRFVTVEELVAERDQVACRWTTRGTHLGELEGLPPTGRRMEFPEVAIYTLADGRVTRIWHMVNVEAMLRQLGVVPSGPPPLPVRILLNLARRRRTRRPAEAA